MTISISELRTRVQHANGKLDFELLDHITALGEEASVLMPLLVERFREGRLLIPATHLIPLFESTRHGALLDVFRGQRGPNAFSVDDQCRLLMANRREFDEPLRNFLANNMDDYSSPVTCQNCCDVARALGNAGSTEVKPLLEYVQSKLERETNPSGPMLPKYLLDTVTAALSDYAARGRVWDSCNTHEEKPKKKSGVSSKPWAEREKDVRLLDRFEEYKLSAKGRATKGKFCVDETLPTDNASVEAITTRINSQEKWERRLLDDVKGNMLSARSEEEYAQIKCPGIPHDEFRRLIERERRRRQST